MIPRGGIGLSHSHQRRPILNRMARIEGHLRAAHRMLEEDRDCPDVLIQLAAVRAALDRVARLVFEDHMDSCILDAVQSGDAETKIAEIKAAFARYFVP
jgi:DNA-binding FrmR family transcriptional regulator